MPMLRDPDAATAPVVGLAEQYLAGVTDTHSHARGQLMFAVEGTMIATTDRGSWVLPTNRALFVPGGHPHALQFRRPAQLRTVYIDSEVPWAPKMPLPAVVSVPPLLRELILAVVDLEWDYRNDSDSARLARVLCDRLRVTIQEPVHLPEPSDPRAKRFASIYQNDPSERRVQNEVARSVGSSKRTLDRLFKAETGLSVGAWIQQCRLLAGLELIASGTPVGDAAFQTGFENPSSFIALFRRQFGTTPARFFNRA
jgi:AraC-like DNA-binding protein